MTIAPPDAAGAIHHDPAPGPYLLHDALVITSRQRAGDPELPAATVAAAQTAPIHPECARFDVIELPGPLDSARLAPELARHGHRVFSLRPASAEADSPEPGLIPVPITLPSADARQQDAVRLAVLETLRRAAAIETAVLLLRDPAWTDAAVRARERWGWRIVVDGGTEPVAPRLERAAGLIVSARAPLDRPGGGRDTRSGPRRIARTAGWEAVEAAIRALFPLASIIVVSFNTLPFTRLCLASLLSNTDYPNTELIVVDNGSSDGSVEALHELASQHAHLRLILNDDNLGFGPANNQGLAIARGELLVLLNSDTMVPVGWLSRLAHHLADPRLGLIGPATNRTCNEAQIAAPYSTYGELLQFARDRAAEHDGQRHAIRMPMMFCVAWRRDVFVEVGSLDERYETGMFEDEDYALRVKAAGYETAWAADAYVHHAYHASIGKLVPSGDYVPLFRRNQERFEQKWGICWERHRLPPTPSPPQ
jgi:GT2 family glycosyltransferase